MALPPKAFDTLLLLVQNRERTLDKKELMTALWPETFVEESNLAQQVFTLRKLLGEQANGRPYIETVPKHGYHFAARVTESPAGQAPPAARRPLMRWPVWVAAVALVGGFGLYRFAPHRRDDRPRPGRLQNVQIRKLTKTGKVLVAAISSDGRYVGYVTDETGQQSLWVAQVSIGHHVELVRPAEERYVGLTFSPDASWIYYVRGGSLHRVPVLGGLSQPVLEDVERPVSFSPDGARFAFIRLDLARGESALLLASADGTGQRMLSVRRLPLNYRWVAWSPDGRSLACSVGRESGNRATTVTLVDAATGAERSLASREWAAAGQVAWIPDGTGVIVPAREKPFDPAQIWHVAYPAGEVRRLTNDLMDYRHASVAGDGRLATVQRGFLSNIWLAPDGDAARARPITSGASQDSRPCWTPDGRIVYQSEASGRLDIWIMDHDGSGRRRLTANSCDNFSPAVSPDGRSIAFASDCAGTVSLAVIDADGGHARQLTRGGLVDFPSWSPDGRWIVYEASQGGKPTLWKVAAEGGEAARLTETLSRTPAVSPDGREIALYHWDERPTSPVQIAVIPFAGGPPSKTFERPETAPRMPLRWAPGGRSLAYVVDHGGSSNVWRQPLDGGPPRPLTHFRSDRIFAFDWSRDGRHLALARGVMLGDVVVIEDAARPR